jgi:hypothetical protein
MIKGNMETWSVMDIKNMSTSEMRSLLIKLQEELRFREGIGEELRMRQDPQLLVEEDPVVGI